MIYQNIRSMHVEKVWAIRKARADSLALQSLIFSICLLVAVELLRVAVIFYLQFVFFDKSHF